MPEPRSRDLVTDLVTVAAAWEGWLFALRRWTVGAVRSPGTRAARSLAAVGADRLGAAFPDQEQQP